MKLFLNILKHLLTNECCLHFFFFFYMKVTPCLGFVYIVSVGKLHEYILYGLCTNRSSARKCRHRTIKKKKKKILDLQILLQGLKYHVNGK